MLSQAVLGRRALSSSRAEGAARPAKKHLRCQGDGLNSECALRRASRFPLYLHLEFQSDAMLLRLCLAAEGRPEGRVDMNGYLSTVASGFFAALAIAGFVCFSVRYWRRGAMLDQSGVMFADPMLRLIALSIMGLLGVLAPLNTAGTAFYHSPIWWVVAVTGATVAGADFILLLAAIVIKRDEYVRQYFRFETKKKELAVRQPMMATNAMETPIEPELDAEEVDASEKQAVQAPLTGTEDLAAGPRPGFDEADAAEQRSAAWPSRDTMPALVPGRRGAATVFVKPMLQPFALALAAPADASRRVRVAVLSGGIHPTLLEVGWIRSRVERIPGFPIESVSDDLFTGTAAAAMILTAGDDVRLCVANPFDERGATTADRSLQALDAALAWKPDVLLADMGVGTEVASWTELIAGSDCLIVAPAGHDGAESCDYPAACEGVLAVTASRDGVLCRFANRGGRVDVAAPGEDVPSVVRISSAGEVMFREASGTSLSAALVAAMITSALSAGAPAARRPIRNALRSGRYAAGAKIPLLDPAQFMKKLHLTGTVAPKVRAKRVA